MTDEALEQRLRAFYRGVDAEPTPLPLRRDVAAIADVTVVGARRTFNVRSWALLAAAALLAVALVGGAILGAGLLRVNNTLLVSPSPDASPLASHIATVDPSPTSSSSPSVSAQPSATTPFSGT